MSTQLTLTKPIFFLPLNRKSHGLKLGAVVRTITEGLALAVPAYAVQVIAWLKSQHGGLVDASALPLIVR